MAPPGSGWVCWVLAAFLPVLAACNGTTGGSSSADTAASPAASVSPAPPQAAPAGGAAPLQVADPTAAAPELSAHLAGRLSVDPGAITVISIEPVTWPNGCLGLESAGQVCSQARVDGWLAILLGPDGREYRYRGAATYFLPE